MIFTVAGGDLRSVYLAKRLLRDGHRVRCFGLEHADVPVHCRCNTLTEAMQGTECVVLPTPAMDGNLLRMPLSGQTVNTAELVSVLPRGVPVFAGAPGAELTALCQEQNIRLMDLLSIESLTLRNAALTAECAVGLALMEVPYTLMGEPVLILGAGRIGKALAVKLRDLGAVVTVAARKSAHRGWCTDRNMGAVHIHSMHDRLPEFRLVVNTIPARIFNAELLSQLPQGAHLMELASKPGGFDPEIAKNLGLTVLPAGGLPGKYAPESAADAIAETIYSMTER